LRPLVCYGQTRASRPPPLQHRVPMRGEQDRFRGRALASACQIALGPFQSRIGRLFRARSLETFPGRPVGPRGFRTSHEPLYETIPGGITAVTRWRAKVSCDPWSFRHTSAPEKHRCSQVSPRPVVLRSSPKETFRRLGGGDAFTGSRRFPAPSHSASRLPTPCLGRTSCLFSTHARVSWRQAEVCLRPLICFGQTRASRPPPLQHRVPTRAVSKIRSLEISASVSLIRITPGLFQSQGNQPWEQALGLDLRPVRFSLTASWTYV